MLKKTITFTDFNGELCKEDHFFHLSKADLIELEMSHAGGLSARIESIVASEDGKLIIEEFRRLLLMSYGVKSDDGRRFIKNNKLREDFASSEAYSTLFMELVTNPEAAAEFVNGIVPAGLDEDLAKLQPEKTTPPPVDARHEVMATPRPRVITKAEAIEMDADELKYRLAYGDVVIGAD